MNKRFIICNMQTNEYYTGMYYDEKEVWDIDFRMAERFLSMEEVDDLFNDGESGEPMHDFFKKQDYLEIKTIYVKES